MLKLIVSNGQLSINDGKIVLSKWVSESYYGKVVILDSNGIVVASQKVSVTNPIETQVGERTSAADVIGDVGANFKSGAFLGYYQSVMIGSTLDIVEKEGLWYYKNYGIGLSDADIQIKKTKIATFDGTAYLECDYDLDLYGITITTFTGTSTPSINGTAIEFTAGTAEYLKLSNGAEYWFQESDGVEIYNRNGDKVGLFTAVSGNGTLNITSQLLPVGTSVSIEATPDPEHELDRVDITDAGGLTQITTESFNWVIDSATSMVAYFQVIFQVIQDVFSTTPELIGDSYFFKSLAGNNQKWYNIVCYGNSITDGRIYATQSYPAMLKLYLDSLNINSIVHNLGFGGAEGNYLDDNFDTLCLPYFSTDVNAINVGITFEFTNQLKNNIEVTNQEAVDSVLSICNKMQALGAQVIVLTATPYGNDDYQNNRIQGSNELLRQQYTANADYLLDVNTISQLYPWNSTYYGDNLHPLDYQYHRDLIVPVIINNIVTERIDSDVEIKNTNCAYFENWELRTNAVISINTNEVIRFKFKSNKIGDEGVEYIWAIGDDPDNYAAFVLSFGSFPYESFMVFVKVNGEYPLRMYGRGYPQMFKDGLWHTVELHLNGDNKIFIDGKLHEVSYAYGNSSSMFTLQNKTLCIGNRKSVYPSTPSLETPFKGWMCDFEMTDFKTSFDANSGLIEFDNSGNENNCTLTDDDGTNYRTYQNLIMPKMLISGCSVFENISDFKILFRQYIDGLPAETIVGYTKLFDAPAGSGILKGLPNTYDGLQITGLETDATFEQILALENSSTIEITKDDNTISRLKVKQ